VLLYGEDPVPQHFFVFARLEGRTGAWRSDAEVVIPGYLFAGDEGTRAELDDTRALGTRFLQQTETTLDRIELPGGLWRIETEGIGDFEHAVELETSQAGPVDITIAAAPPAFLTQVTLRRVVR
jgi:hypothetical protein